MDSRSKTFTAIAIAFIFIGLTFITSAFSFGKLKLTFCDVGQGDGILITTIEGSQILVDGGVGSRVLECLSNNMPIWDKKIEVMVLTHPQKDHMEGQVAVFEKYDVENVVYTGVDAESNLYVSWKDHLANEGTKVTLAKNDKKIVSGSVEIQILWPDPGSVELWKNSPPRDLNDSSVVLKLTYGSFCGLLTGDAPTNILETVAPSCEVLKVAHHGSKTGTNESLISKIKPKVAIIQSGKNNSYGHPHQEVLKVFENNNVRVLRNDQEGEITIFAEPNGDVSLN